MVNLINGEFDLFNTIEGSGFIRLAIASDDPSANNDNIVGSNGDDVIDGLDGADFIQGLDGADMLSGGLGDDIILGGAGNDIIDGGAGADILYDGFLDDILTGGADADIFVIQDDPNSAQAGAIDRITDFEDNIDTLDLSAHFGTPAEALAAAQQQGSDVLFDLGDTHFLIVENITLAQIADDIDTGAGAGV